MILLFSIGSRNLNAKVVVKRKSTITEVENEIEKMVGEGKERAKAVRAFDV